MKSLEHAPTTHMIPSKKAAERRQKPRATIDARFGKEHDARDAFRPVRGLGTWRGFVGLEPGAYAAWLNTVAPSGAGTEPFRVTSIAWLRNRTSL